MPWNRTWDDWIAEYAASHQNPVNRFLHTLGIPAIVLSIIGLITSIFISGLWPYALALFIVGWIFQFVGHAIEGEPPEFMKDWRFLFVGLRWWFAKLRGKA